MTVLSLIEKKIDVQTIKPTVVDFFTGSSCHEVRSTCLHFYQQHSAMCRIQIMFFSFLAPSFRMLGSVTERVRFPRAKNLSILRNVENSTRACFERERKINNGATGMEKEGSPAS
jgi:hypothetical protein